MQIGMQFWLGITQSPGMVCMKGRGTAPRPRADLGASEGDMGPGAPTSPCISHFPVPQVFLLPRQQDLPRFTGTGCGEWGWMDRGGRGGGWSDCGPRGCALVAALPLCVGAVLPPCHARPLSPCRGCICHSGRAGDTGHGELCFSEDRHFIWTPDSRNQQGWWLQLGSCQVVWLSWGEGRGEQGCLCCREGFIGFLWGEEDRLHARSGGGG